MGRNPTRSARASLLRQPRRASDRDTSAFTLRVISRLSVLVTLVLCGVVYLYWRSFDPGIAARAKHERTVLTGAVRIAPRSPPRRLPLRMRRPPRAVSKPQRLQRPPPMPRRPDAGGGRVPVTPAALAPPRLSMPPAAAPLRAPRALRQDALSRGRSAPGIRLTDRPPGGG